MLTVALVAGAVAAAGSFISFFVGAHVGYRRGLRAGYIQFLTDRANHCGTPVLRAARHTGGPDLRELRP